MPAKSSSDAPPTDPRMPPADPDPTPRPAPLHARGMLAGVDATHRLAARVATCLTPGFRLYLTGDLGTGKTTLVRELLRALGHRGRVASPTYTLIEPYNLSRFDLHHFDFYRLTHPGAWRDAGFEDAFDSQTVVVVEWPEHAGDGLPAPDLHLWLSADPGEAEDARGLAATAFSDRGQACLTALRDAGFCATVPSPDWGCAAR